MREQTSTDQPAALADVPMLAEYDKEFSSPTLTSGPSVAATHRQPVGVYSSDELRSRAVQLATGDLDWAQVVDLRRRASEIITDEAEDYARSSGRPLASEDRLLLGRSIIRRVVADHVRSLHRSGAELWSPAREEAYVTAVENSIFGYGRLQPLLEMPEVENIEIHGWDSVVVQYGDGRRRHMPPVADNDTDLVEAIRFLGQNSEPSRPFDDTHPTMTLAIGERFRLHAMAFGLSYRPSIVIRQHTLTDVSLADLADGGLMP